VISEAEAVPTIACRGDDSPTTPGRGEGQQRRKRRTRWSKNLERLLFSNRSERAEAEVGEERPRCAGTAQPLAGRQALSRRARAGGSSSALVSKGPPSANLVVQHSFKNSPAAPLPIAGGF